MTSLFIDGLRLPACEAVWREGRLAGAGDWPHSGKTGGQTLGQ